MRILSILALLAFTAIATPARADGLVLDLSPAWTCSPVGMLTGFQYNLKTGDFQKGVALGAGYGCRYTGWKIPLGVDIVGGAAINSNAPNAGQGSVVFTADDLYGVGGGAQFFKDPSTGSLTGQVIFSFFLAPSWAATVTQLKAAKATASAEGAKAAKAGQ
jgi:hypothetical protein